MELEINRVNLLQKCGYLPGTASIAPGVQLAQIDIGDVYRLAEEYIEVTLPYIPEKKRDEWLARVRDILLEWDPRGANPPIKEVEP